MVPAATVIGTEAGPQIWPNGRRKPADPSLDPPANMRPGGGGAEVPGLLT